MNFLDEEPTQRFRQCAPKQTLGPANLKPMVSGDGGSEKLCPCAGPLCTVASIMYRISTPRRDPTVKTFQLH